MPAEETPVGVAQEEVDDGQDEEGVQRGQVSRLCVLCFRWRRGGDGDQYLVVVREGGTKEEGMESMAFS